ncbi:xanthine dehydrogenase accessory protein XdhC [Cohaesibacter haloalkalitolerans]|uniref:xanthine dehydrogenase accessory protein XdhC n=1 Tax=Cohaesibacter haloalkalitolerans TaxID=1162980 RepID=UPI000E652EB1|nr:xanthine dehydrogenase accessory protein XdhC [Cohaesibacter haloalkalitolerans]
MAEGLALFLQEAGPVIKVCLSDVRGSSPREAGASLYVTEKRMHGTIGGGQLEYIAIDEARRMLGRGEAEKRLAVPLGPEIGQCCGGAVTLSFALMDEAQKEAEIAAERKALDALHHVYIFGAGHVGRALARALHLLPVRPILVDSRAEELALVDVPVEQRLSALPEAEIRAAPPASAFLILTHDHALDFLLAREALARADAAYVGMIGSKSKRATFSHWLKREAPDQAEALLPSLVCPIGRHDHVRDKRPEVIAAMVAAELLGVLLRDLPSGQSGPDAHAGQADRIF